MTYELEIAGHMVSEVRKHRQIGVAFYLLFPYAEGGKDESLS